jgi:hypothetical protein
VVGEKALVGGAEVSAAGLDVLVEISDERLGVLGELCYGPFEGCGALGVQHRRWRTVRRTDGGD